MFGLWRTVNWFCSLSGGELFNQVSDENHRMSEAEIINYMRQICDAVRHMHEQNIVHLDIKVRLLPWFSSRGLDIEDNFFEKIEIHFIEILNNLSNLDKHLHRYEQNYQHVWISHNCITLSRWSCHEKVSLRNIIVQYNHRLRYNLIPCNLIITPSFIARIRLFHGTMLASTAYTYHVLDVDPQYNFSSSSSSSSAQRPFSSKINQGYGRLLPNSIR